MRFRPYRYYQVIVFLYIVDTTFDGILAVK